MLTPNGATLDEGLPGAYNVPYKQNERLLGAAGLPIAEAWLRSALFEDRARSCATSIASRLESSQRVPPHGANVEGGRHVEMCRARGAAPFARVFPRASAHHVPSLVWQSLSSLSLTLSITHMRTPE